jgi:hypothetical protein
MTNDGNNKCLLTFPLPFPGQGRRRRHRRGDVCRVQRDHRVTRVVDERTIVTDQAYSADATGQRRQARDPGGEQPCTRRPRWPVERVRVTDTPVVPYVNQDPQGPNQNRGVPQDLRKFSVAGTYKRFDPRP